MQRLDKILSNLGYGTRNEIKKVMKKGIVSVNDVVVKDASMKVDTENDIIEINGEQVFYREFIYLMMNKPDGVISATYDNRDETVVDLLEVLLPITDVSKNFTGTFLLFYLSIPL